MLAAVFSVLAFNAFSDSNALVRIIDGDSINLGKERHRLQGIDAPEHRQTCQRLNKTIWQCGREATSALKERIGDTSVTCQSSGRDRYGRFLSTCYSGDINLNRWMVRHGWAVAYRKYSHQFICDEEAAKRDQVGLWSGEFVMPWDWRRGVRFGDAMPVDMREIKLER